MTKTKKIWQSKTFWINIAVIFAGITAALAEMELAGVALTGVGALNVALRVITTQAVKLEW